MGIVVGDRPPHDPIADTFGARQRPVTVLALVVSLPTAIAVLGLSVKVSLLKIVRMSPETILAVITVLMGMSVSPSDGVMVTAPAGAASLIVTEKSFVAVPPPVTWTVKLKVPAAVGVPLRTPAEDRFRPAGSVPADTDQLYGVVPPVAASAWL